MVLRRKGPPAETYPQDRHAADKKTLIDFDPGGLDDRFPLVGVLFQKLRKVVRGGALDRICVTFKLLDERRHGQSFGDVAIYLFQNLRRRLGWCEDALPGVNYITGKARLGDGRHVRCGWRSFGPCRGQYADLARPRISEQFTAAEIAVNTTRD